MLRGSTRNFKAGLWLEALGIKEFAKVETLGEAYRCDGTGCLLSVKGKQIAFPKRREVAIEDCTDADAIIAPFKLNCERAITIGYPYHAVSLTMGEAITKAQAEPFTARLSTSDK